MKNSRKQHISKLVMKQHRKTIELNKKLLFSLSSLLKFEEKKNKLKADWRAREACKTWEGGVVGISRASEVDGTDFLIYNFYVHLQTKSLCSRGPSLSTWDTFQDPQGMPETASGTKPHVYLMFFPIHTHL